MTLRLRVDPSSEPPIWRQIEDGVRHLIAIGALAPGAPVPSVRALATDLVVNPATVARAYQRLTDAGVLVVRRGDGTYVAEKPPVVPRAERTRTLREAAHRFAVAAVNAGATREEALAAVEQALDQPSREKRAKEHEERRTP